MSSTPNRPEFLDLRSKSQASVSRPLRSPRLHIAGEAPPELSPLDAFALQSRLLAKQLQESAKTGRRMSRLPPLTTDSPLIVQARSDYFRSLSHDSASEEDFHQQSASSAPASGFKPEVEDDVSNRPVSVHPRMSRIPPTPDESIPLPTMPNMDSLKRDQGDGRSLRDLKELRDEINDGEGEGFFGVGARREQSPGPIESNTQEKLSRTTTNESFTPAEKLSRSTTHDSPAPVGKLSRSTTHDSIPLNSPGPTHSITSSPERIIKQKSFDSAGLIPPRPLFTKRSSSLMSAQLDTTDEEGTSTLGTSFHSQGSRKLSTSSSIMSPSFAPYQRSPSISSDISGLPRPSFNFSRPMSRAGTPTFDSPARQASSDSHASFLFADESATTPISMTSDGFHDGNAEDGSSNMKPTYNLPRGKALQRDSVIIPNSTSTPTRFSWEEPINSQPQQTYNTSFQAYQPPPSPPSRPATSTETQTANVSRPSQEPSKLSTELYRAVQESSAQPRASIESARVSSEAPRGRPPLITHDLTRNTSLSGTTSDSASTIKDVRSPTAGAPTMTELSAEEHVTKAIDLHENGSLQESTWHLRHAAKQNHPTGMLLYALACRHGWGMRPNPKEGVDWLRKAVECASLEVKDDEEHIKEGQRVDVTERKTHKAQFALGVYELGVSHMNGWGIDQDKALALKCFEIAAAWGDVDALAEAGFCYAQGIGCKKDLKKSAKYYREAEAKGMNMVGNSWIHKAKYNEDAKDSEKARPKSRARKSIFSRKTHS
ncbi:hypothetical protein QBC38DRAFT_85028 [Podospora fimiseda]|uniref:Cell cycle inhibitor Nif1 n=1 Tax=Podospora fimiseda TaxID=252190 RepID=A0AAN7BUF0_9PEZI|nr:hypothetical protein QBC38DRAFT_85028 [Podospora fimiseda]